VAQWISPKSCHHPERKQVSFYEIFLLVFAILVF
jgi:hypothetical protein